MRKRLIATLVVACLGQAGASGIPVVDVAGNAIHLQEKLENVIRWKTQLDAWKNQYGQMKQQYEAVRGIRKAADLLNFPEVRKQIPQEYQRVVSLAMRLERGEIKGGDGANQALKEAIAIIKAGQLRNRKADEAVQVLQTAAADDMAAWDAAWKKSSDRITEIQYLMDKIKDTDYATDPKDIADLQARLQSEQQFLTLENTRLSIMKNMQEARNHMLENQRQEQDRLRGGSAIKYDLVNPFQ